MTSRVSYYSWLDATNRLWPSLHLKTCRYVAFIPSDNWPLPKTLDDVADALQVALEYGCMGFAFGSRNQAVIGCQEWIENALQKVKNLKFKNVHN
jgi:hypothetical protein